ncbi:hypothetical protein [Oecophyllibacter saccharovorans]|uniref:Uncharacterized protein n=1 Tax=Oecophyllibacter saccharovorans TaxID=2558360 RepID=A0A506UQH2_9PROT|nr:hypothetical protein [Oecophyllibacter saccharovorans]TPW35598.1 hypothetical protein E3202_01080 [Oecophyllibacter saccharovorans]
MRKENLVDLNWPDFFMARLESLAKNLNGFIENIPNQEENIKLASCPISKEMDALCVLGGMSKIDLELIGFPLPIAAYSGHGGGYGSNWTHNEIVKDVLEKTLEKIECAISIQKELRNFYGNGHGEDYIISSLPKKDHEEVLDLLKTLRDTILGDKDLSISFKIALLRKIDQFEKIWIQEKSSFDFVLDKISEITLWLGQQARNLEPAINIVDKITRIVYRFSPHAEPSLLEAPTKPRLIEHNKDDQEI